MPFLRQWQTSPQSVAGIWEVTESEEFFRDAMAAINGGKIFPVPERSHPRRRLEHLAGRYLLQAIRPGFPLSDIYTDAWEKPRLPNNVLYFSISHSLPYVMAQVSASGECGVDIQCFHPRIRLLAGKFLSKREQELFGDDPALLTMAWSIKESAYKWNGGRGIDFIGHLRIMKLVEETDRYEALVHFHKNNTISPVKVRAQAESDRSFAFVVE